HRASAGVLQANIFHYRQRCRNILVALAGFLANPAQVLCTADAVFLLVHQIMYDPFALQMAWQCLTTTSLLRCPRTGSRLAGSVIIGLFACMLGVFRVSRFAFGLPRLPQRCEQCQLIRRELFALPVALGIQQLAQQALYLAAPTDFAIQLP